ncbi:CHRD domain-containing protein [Yinghuangia sp. YIM S09857]|uniref:CHRD domain-containing protein n=1 Tax=Yinghuangia sp. YIM S09857 TaxID=3436929 RepID=UPI003F53C0D5
MSVRRFTLPAAMLTAVLMTGLTACGSSDGDAKSAAPPGNAPQNAPADTGGQASADAPGQNAPSASPPDAGHGSGHDPAAAGGPPADQARDTGAAEPAAGDEVFFVANLTGTEEVPGTDGKAVGDQDGKATAYVRIKGNQMAFAIKWQNIAAPSAAHIHQGAKGANGAVVVPFFASPLPDTANAATGSVAVADPGLLDRIRNNPGNWYFNLHTGEFPGGAVRGQLTRLDKPVDLNSVLRTGKPEGTLTVNATGAQEVPNKDDKPIDDQDGRAVTAVRPWGNCVDYAFSWKNVAPPTLGHVHKAPAGRNGDVVAPLWASEKGLPQSITGLSGTVEGVKPEIVAEMSANPAGFYTNLHTGEFSGGAVRGQLG